MATESTPVVFVRSAADQLRALDAPTRMRIIDAIEQIARDPATAASVALDVKGDFSTRPLLTAVPGEPAAIFWTLHGTPKGDPDRVVLLSVVTTNYDELVESAFVEAESQASRFHSSVSSRDLIEALRDHGFTETRQKGGHVVLARSAEGQRFTVVVPSGRERIPRGTLQAILRQAGLTAEDL